MKYGKIILAVVIILLLLTPSVALAQDDAGLPQTAVDALNWLNGLVVLAGGLVAGAVTDWVKTLKFLGATEQEQIGGHAAKLIAAIVSAAAGIGLAYLMPYALDLDASGGYAAILAILTVLANKGVFEAERVLRSVSAYLAA